MSHPNHGDNDGHKQKSRGSWVEKGWICSNLISSDFYPQVILSFLFSGLPPKNIFNEIFIEFQINVPT